MASKPKSRKMRKPVPANYEIEIQDWGVYFHLATTLGRSRAHDGDYAEDSCLFLYGKVLSPSIKDVTKVELNIWERPELNDHWKNTPSEKPPSSVGMLQILRDKITLHGICWVPERLFRNIFEATAVGKIKYVSVNGEKLRWGRGWIANISFSTSREEE